MQVLEGASTVARLGVRGRGQVEVGPRRGRTAAMIPGASAASSRVRRRVRAVHATMTADDPTDRPRRGAWPRRPAPGRGLARVGVRRPRPTARLRPSRRPWPRSCSAGRSSRCRRWASSSPSGWWWWAVRRVDRAHPTNPVPRRRSRLLRARRCSPWRSPCCRASSATTRPCSRSTWSSTSCCPRRGAAPRPGRADHAAAAGGHARRPPALDPAGPPFAGRARAGLPGRGLAALRRGHVGQPLLAAVRRGPRGPARPRPRAPPVPRRPRCCSGGRRRRSTRRRGGCPTRRAPCTSSCRCPRTRSWPWSSSARRPSSTRTTPRLIRTWGPTAARRPAARGRDHVDRRRPDLPGRDPGILWAGCGPRPATRPGPTGGRPRSWPRSASREARLAERLRARGASERSVGERRRRGSAGTPSGSTFPPLTTADDRARRAGSCPSSAAWKAIAATVSAPDGSTTSRLRSAARRTPAAISASLTVTIPSRRARRWANVRRPSDCVRVPSAIVRDTCVGRPAHDLAAGAGDSRASAASSGSTPMTRASGRSALTAVATPLASPPPPIGTRTSGDVGQVLDDLQPDRALAGDDPVVVVGRDDRPARARAASASATRWRSSMAVPDDRRSRRRRPRPARA